MNINEEIHKLKKERRAVILAHNYQVPEVQDIADYVGDSLGLSIQAARTDAEVIVFCGVHFMAETAKILSPDKKVLLPDLHAGCPMADMIDAEQLRALKAQHPKAKVICYVNTTAAVKAECDLCCTSANAVKMVGEVLKDAEEIIFVPDQYLAAYVTAKTGRKMITWQGCCPTHAKILPEHLLEGKKRRPAAEIIAHPECRPEVTRIADVVASTEGMLTYIRDSKTKEFIVGTEQGIIHRMQKQNPDKQFYEPAKAAICPDMKRITLEKVLRSLKDMVHEISVPPETADRARTSIRRMLDHVD
ncbi:MAG: quinolinate synthase NadA [Deltaproteobacteria bacterium]|nr:quinolinate synthase NadA [Deltaproteobacteria bacterium]